MEWLDEPWPEHVPESLKKLWKEVRDAKRNKARATDALHGAINMNDVALVSRLSLQEEVKRTKRVAQRICATYARKATMDALDNNKLMYLIYCLLGVIIFLVVAIFFRPK